MVYTVIWKISCTSYLSVLFQKLAFKFSNFTEQTPTIVTIYKYPTIAVIRPSLNSLLVYAKNANLSQTISPKYFLSVFHVTHNSLISL